MILRFNPDVRYLPSFQGEFFAGRRQMVMQLPKGVFDVLPRVDSEEDLWKLSSIWSHVESVARQVCFLYGFQEIRTPIFERTEVFHRVGETTDIVSKETYTFLDRKGRSLTLRPEGTAAVVRALIEHRLYERVKENKLFYLAPMFRYERQQAGRYRQHHQFGVEAIGIKHPLKDAEIVYLLWDFYSLLGVKDVALRVNCLGGRESRESYQKALKDYLQQYFDYLSPLSQDRFHSNPLRILDSKEKEDQELLQKAPSILDFLKKEELEYFQEVCQAIKEKNISYIVDPLLVRGLDYYSGFVFEAFTSSAGAQNSIGGGGRYDGLVEASEGPELPSCGFGVGLERVIRALMLQKKISRPEGVSLRLLPLGLPEEEFCFFWANQLRESQIPVEVDLSGKNVREKLKAASYEKVRFVCVVGSEEIKSRNFVLRDMVNRVDFKGLQEEIKEKILYEIQNTHM